MIACPICATASKGKREGTPYEQCPGCGVWWQDPMPPKAYLGPEEPPYTDDDKRVNASLAKWLFDDVMGDSAGRTLDVGAKLPYLSHSFAALGCEAFAIDAEFDKGAEELDVGLIQGDFEQWDGDGAFRLITLIHVFEHLYDPLAAIKKLRRLTAEHGRVFLRIPDHQVQGFERDLTPHHYAIHPFFHSLSSITELLARAGDAFVVERFTPFAPGQCDFILKPITKRPTIGLGMIVKNEERDLPRLLRSVHDVVDGGVIVDTGSTDSTLAVIGKLHKYDYCPMWTDASELVDGDWKLVNFAKARNAYVDRVRADGFDWLLWMDADDELLTPLAVNRARYMPPAAFGMWIDLGGGIRQVHYRMWPTAQPIMFKGWCHEYPVLPAGLPAPVLNDVCIRHDATPGTGETSNARNLRILEKQYAAEPDARCAFYIANTHKDGGRHREAITWYERRIGYGMDFRDEYLFALLYLARELFADGQKGAGRDACEYGLAIAPDWQEFRVELANAEYRDRHYNLAIKHAHLALDQPCPPTVLWREKDKYADQPARIVSWCHQHQGRLADALAWSEVAASRIPGHDLQWTARHRMLIGMRNAERNAPPPAAPAFVTRRREHIALVRPGAIGDVLMTLNLIPAFREANPDAFISYYTHPSIGAPDALLPYMLQAGVDVVMDIASAQAMKADRKIMLVGYPLAEGYPDKPMQHHLLQYFAAEMGLPHPLRGVPALELPKPAHRYSQSEYATIQMEAGWSKYKEWSSFKWEQVINALRGYMDLVVIREKIGRTLAESISIIANAKMHLGVDSFGNHLTNYFWKDGNAARRVPGVILWGSTQMEAAGYPTNINIGHRLPCGPCFRENPAISQMPRGLCVDPPGQTRHDEGVHACMASITVDEVVAAALELWERAK